MNSSVFFLVLVLVSVTAHENEDPDEIAKSIKARLFSSNVSEQIEPSKTLKLLKKLSKIYSSLSSSDDKLENRNIRWNQLIEISNVTKDKCNFKYLTRLQKLIRNRFKDFVNLASYLKEQRSLQFVVCKEKLEKELREKVDELDDSTKKKVFALRDSVIAAEGGRKMDKQYLVVSLNSIQLGILNFIIKNSKINKKQLLLDEDGVLFSQEFTKFSASVCIKVKEKLDKITKVYSMFLYGRESHDIDQFVVEWLENMKICNTMLQDVNEFSKETYNLIKSNVLVQRQDVAQRLLSFFKGESI